jgi:hypothetical protein
MPLRFDEIVDPNDLAVLDKIKDVVPVKEPPRVVRQTPAPGSPLLRGMTVEVRLLSPSDVILADIASEPPLALRDVPIPEFKKWVDQSPVARELLDGDRLPPERRAEFLRLVNEGLKGVAKGTVTEAEVDRAFASLKPFGRA